MRKIKQDDDEVQKTLGGRTKTQRRRRTRNTGSEILWGKRGVTEGTCSP